MKVFERIQEYLVGEEIQKETRARLNKFMETNFMKD